MAEARLRYELHSPLTLNLYDDQGRHTGISTTTGQVEEQIPGTYYKEWGHVKYIFTDASTSAHIIMNGYAAGIFTFNVDQLVGNSIIASTTFKDIPTTASTTVSIDVQSDISTLSSLRIDKNRDGLVDQTLIPKLNDIATVDTTAASTSVMINGTKGKNNWYTSNVIVSFIATDMETGVKNIYYSVDGFATSTATSTLITTEGSHILTYYSEDIAGNVELPHALVIKIDKTPPEAKMQFDPSAQSLRVTGIDTLSSTTNLKRLGDWGQTAS